MYAYYALHKLHLLPSQFMAMDRQEKAFVIACIDLKIKADADEAKRLKAKSRK